MPLPDRRLLLFLLVTTLVRADGPPAATGTQVATDKPIINFRLPDFTPEGNRSWLVRGSEARYTGTGVVAIRELNLTVFTGQADGRVETLLLSPAAEVRLEEQQVSGDESIRVINDRFEATGAQWRYDHRAKKVSIAKNVRVVLHTQLKDILK